jgi:hypothetical protein
MHAIFQPFPPLFFSLPLRYYRGIFVATALRISRAKQVPVDNQIAWDVIMAVVFCVIFAFIGFMSIREFMDMRRGMVPKIVFD